MNKEIEAFTTRRSVRGFLSTPVAKNLIHDVVTAGEYAASGRGKQSPIIIVVTNKEMIEKITRKNAEILGTTSDPFYGAPAILIVLANKAIPTYLYDGTLVMGNMMQAAHALGLGSCWIHRAKEEFETEEGKEMLRSLGIEGEYEGIAHLALGYPAAPLPQPKERKENYAYFLD